MSGDLEAQPRGGSEWVARTRLSLGHVLSGGIVTLLLPYLILLLVHGLSSIHVEQPTILADEVGYLGNARYLSGTAHLPNMQGAQFYHFGYSLFLLPAFWFFSEPLSIYKGAIATNALLASSLYFPLSFILRSFLDVPGRTAAWIAFTCCLYPSLILYSNFAWSENAFVPFYAVSTALFGMFLVSRSTGYSVLFGFFAGFLYTIHPRALPVLAIILAYLLVLALLKVQPLRQVLLSAATMGMVFALTRVVNGHLRALGWAGGGEFSVTTLAGRLLPGSDFPTLIQRALGQLLYLSQASHGLFLLGLSAVLWLVLGNATQGSLRRVLSHPRTGVPIFALITAAGVFVASCTSKLFSLHGPEGFRGADLIHGRYNEAFAVLFLALGLAEYCRKRLPSRQLLWRGIAVAATILCVTAVVAIEVDDAAGKRVAPGAALEEVISPSEVDTVNVPGVAPLVGFFGGLKLYWMSLAAVGAFFLITLAMRFTKRGGLVLLGAFFVSFALYNHGHYVVPANAMARPRLQFVNELSRLGPIEAISYDATHPEPQVLYGAQFLLQNTVFNRFNGRGRRAPESEAVISRNMWGRARRLGARFVISSAWDNALWLMPGGKQTRLPPVSYEGVTLGTEPRFGVPETGFHLPEVFLGAPGRWTNGAAKLKVPLDRANLPELLALETMVPGRQGARLRVLANGVELWNQPIPSDPWSKTFDLSSVPMEDELLIELRSDASPGQRKMGVVVRGLRLMAPGRRSGAAYEGVTLGAESVLGFEESGFHLPERIGGAPARWTNGAALLRVPVNPRDLPRRLQIETTAPGREEAGLRVLANGIELWDEPIPPDPWSKTFDLEQVPMKDVLLIELESDTFSPARRNRESPDTRDLGVAVRAIRLTAHDGFEDGNREGSEGE